MGQKCWYPAGGMPCRVSADFRYLNNTPYLIPFLSVRSRTLDQLRTIASAPSGGKLRFAIYEQVGPPSLNLYPGSRVYQSSDLTFTGSDQKVDDSPNFKLKANTYYWAAIMLSMGDGAFINGIIFTVEPTSLAWTGGAPYPTGFPPPLSGSGLYLRQVVFDLPDPFPLTTDVKWFPGTFIFPNIPLIMTHFSD